MPSVVEKGVARITALLKVRFLRETTESKIKELFSRFGEGL